MNIPRVLTIVALASLVATSLAQTYPESPVIYRQISGTEYTDGINGNGPVHTLAHVPAVRTSRDGRIGLKLLENADFVLLMPEKLTNYVVMSQQTNLTNNSYVMSNQKLYFVNNNGTNGWGLGGQGNYGPFLPAGSSKSHFALYDPTPEFPTGAPGEVINPHNSNGLDIYDMTVITGTASGCLYTTPVEIAVTNPKTSLADIVSITATGPTVGGTNNATHANTLLNGPNGSIHEQMVCGDGRLIVYRYGPNTYTWTNPNNGQVTTGKYELSYSYYTAAEGNPCDASKWTNVYPISHAPFDSRINTKFGFAMQPFRDAANTPIPDGIDNGGTYPWIDRDAKNIFFTVVGDTLRYATVTNGTTNYTQGRYPVMMAPGNRDNNQGEQSSTTRGIVMAGLWTHGKTVLIDNLNNDMDYSGGNGADLYLHRTTLYTNTMTNPFSYMVSYVDIGGGRVDSRNNMPPGDNQNSTIIESQENILNYRKFAHPLTARDVVWSLKNSRHTDEIVFDDYVDPDVFINADMNALAQFSTNTANFTYYSGWNNRTRSFDQPVLLQNAACAPTNRWNVPAYGTVLAVGGVTGANGGGRVEPIAMGGIHGKGFWCTGNNAIQFSVGFQPGGSNGQTFAGHNWYTGIFVDCRFPDDTTLRTLLSFPDGSKICLTGRSQIQYCNAAGSYVHTINLTNSTYNASLAYEGWSHLAWQTTGGGTNIQFFLDGLVYDTYTSTNSLFQPATGTLTVGNTTSVSTAGFRGWIDDFKVIAHTVDPETACNQAGGTLVGLPSGYTGYLTNYAACFPQSTMTAISNLLLNSGQTAYPSYANYYNYTTDYVPPPSATNSTTNMVSVRDAIRFPEGPLYWNAPRPDSSKNQTCLTCHSVDGKGGLSLAALSLHSGTNEDQDTRRQPFQPFPTLGGNIPANSVDFTGMPTNAMTLANGQHAQVDDLLLPSFSNVVVKTFTLVNASNPTNTVDLTVLTNNQVLSLTNYPGVSSFAIRANLNSEQGNVSLSFNNGAPVVPTANPYAITLGSLPTGTNTITASPSQGSPVTISFIVQ